MRRVTAMVGAAAMVLVMSASVFAQGKPNFAGTWTLDAEKTAAANPAPAGGGGRGGAQGPMTIKVDATTFSIERQGQNGPTTTAYVIDGKPNKMTQGQAEVSYTAKVVGSTIEIETTRDMGGQAVTSKAVWAMEGEYLVQSTTQAGRDGGAPTTRKTYYKKG